MKLQSCHGCTWQHRLYATQTYKVFIDTPPYVANCSVPLSKLNAPGNYTPLCATAEVYGPGQERTYCPTAQPYYSAYRSASVYTPLWSIVACHVQSVLSHPAGISEPCSHILPHMSRCCESFVLRGWHGSFHDWGRSW
jgi:hypothetical protein